MNRIAKFEKREGWCLNNNKNLSKKVNFYI